MPRLATLEVQVGEEQVLEQPAIDQALACAGRIDSKRDIYVTYGDRR